MSRETSDPDEVSSLARLLLEALIYPRDSNPPLDPGLVGDEYNLSADELEAIQNIDNREKQTFLAWFRDFVEEALEGAAEGTTLDEPYKVPVPVLDDNFPKHVPVYERIADGFEGDRGRHATLVAIPWDADDIVRIAVWAADRKIKLRPAGAGHTWMPATIHDRATTLLLDMRRFDQEEAPKHNLARFGAGVTMERISSKLREHDGMLACTTAVGEVTLGGVLATGGHGKGTSLSGDQPCTVNALVHSLEVVMFANGQPIADKVDDPDQLAALALHLGSVIVTHATLRVVPAQNYKMDKARLLVRDYFKKSDEGVGRDLRRERPVELMWYPYQRGRKVDAHAIHRRRLTLSDASAEEDEPYRDRLVNFAVRDTDLFFRATLESRKDEARRDIGRNFQRLLSLARIEWPNVFDAHAARIYISHYILRIHAAGWCIVVKRDGITELLRDIAEKLHALQSEFGFPITGPTEVRFTDVDHPSVALSPARAPTGADPGNYYALWLNVLTSRGSGELLHAFEKWLLPRGREDEGRVCGEWPKGWAYNEAGEPWADTSVIQQFRQSFDPTDFAAAKASLQTLDGGILRSPLAALVLGE